MEIRKYFEFVKSDFDAIKSFYIKSELPSKVWDNFHEHFQCFKAFFN